MFTNIPLIINLGESGPLTWDMAKQIIQSQHTLAIYGITAVVGVAAVLLVFSLIWNVFLRRHELKKAIESLKSEIFTKGKEDFAKLTTETKDAIGKMKKEIDKTIEERMTRFDKTIEERMTRFDKTAEERMTRFDADTARLFVLTGYQMKEYEGTAVWCAKAIEGYAKAREEALLRTCVDALNANLVECKKLSDSDKQKIKKCLPSIPEILKEEKEQIEKKLNKLPEEIKEH